MKEPLWLDERDALILHDRLLAIHGGAASLYTAGIVRNHPFADGNKRTGFVIGILFLELNGHAFGASEEDAAQAIFALVAGGLDETSYAAFLAANTRPRKSRR